MVLTLSLLDHKGTLKVKEDLDIIFNLIEKLRNRDGVADILCSIGD
jgi:hypothetical protein